MAAGQMTGADLRRRRETLALIDIERLVEQVAAAVRPVRIGIIGKYVDLPDAYLSVVESLRHAGFHHGAKVEIEWVQAATVPDLLERDGLQGFS